MIILYIFAGIFCLAFILKIINNIDRASSKITSVNRTAVISDYYFQIATSQYSDMTRLFFYLKKGNKLQHELRDIIPIYKFENIPFNSQNRVFDLIDEAFQRKGDNPFCPVVDRDKRTKGIEFRYHNIAYVDCITNDNQIKEAINSVLGKIRRALYIAENEISQMSGKEIKFNVYYIYGAVTHQIT